MIVVDSNIVAYWLLPGENAELIERVWKKDSNWISPILWRSEFRNILAVFIRQEKITLETAFMVMEQAEQILNDEDHRVNSRAVLNLVATSGCTAYDCEFVALAQWYQVRLITSDKQILREFPETAVSPAQFLGEK
jgi:predicted nucleic acid-binding protein